MYNPQTHNSTSYPIVTRRPQFARIVIKYRASLHSTFSVESRNRYLLFDWANFLSPSSKEEMRERNKCVMHSQIISINKQFRMSFINGLCLNSNYLNCAIRVSNIEKRRKKYLIQDYVVGTWFLTRSSKIKLAFRTWR